MISKQTAGKAGLYSVLTFEELTNMCSSWAKFFTRNSWSHSARRLPEAGASCGAADQRRPRPSCRWVGSPGRTLPHIMAFDKSLQ